MSRLAVVPPAERALALAETLRPYALTAGVAAATFWLAYDGGSFDLPSRNGLAVALWWTVVLGVLLGLLPRAPLTRAAALTGGLLGAFALLALVSAAWADSAERAVDEFNRGALYLAVFLVTALIVRPGEAARVSDGLAVGIAGTALLALASRCYPDVVSDEQALGFLPSAQNRLSFPLDYWNGLAILSALGIPLLLRAALAHDRPLARALALAPLPAIAGVVYLTSSRGGVATALVGTLAFLFLTARRFAALAAAAVAGLGSVAAVAVLHARTELVNQPGTPEAVSQGRAAGLLVAALCLATGIGYVLARRFLPGTIPLGRRTERAVIGGAAVVLLLGVVAANPVERFREFKRPPGALTERPDQEATQAHLTSGSGTGRWQQWETAAESFETRPLIGRGAGSFEAWWAQHGSLPEFVSDAHSLYLETLAELGLIGFALIAALVAMGLVLSFVRLRRASGEARVTAAALSAAFLAYAAAAGVDWMWEMTVVTVVAIVVLALLTGSGLLPPQGVARLPVLRGRLRVAVGAATVLIGALVIYGEAAPLLADARIVSSQRAVERGDTSTARQHALDARSLEPWASSPYLQLALIDEQSGNLRDARAWIVEAIDRDSANWRLWLVASRLETKSGEFDSARRSLRRAAELNPRSRLFAGLAQPPA